MELCLLNCAMDFNKGIDKAIEIIKKCSKYFHIRLLSTYVFLTLRLNFPWIVALCDVIKMGLLYKKGTKS